METVHRSAVKQSVKMKRYVTMIITLLLLVVLLFISVIICSFRAQNAYKEEVELTKYAIQFKTGSQNLTNAVRAYAATGDKQYYDDYYYELETAKNRDIALEGLGRIGISEKEQNYIDQISQTSNQLVPLEEASMEAVDKGDTAYAVEAVYGDAYNDSLTIIHGLTAELIDELGVRAQSQEQVISVISVVLDVICFIVLLLAIVLILKIIRFVGEELIQPILVMETEFECIASGNLKNEFPLMADESEIGMLTGSIHSTKDMLNRIIGEISYVLGKMADGCFAVEMKETYAGDFAQIKQSFELIINNMNETFSKIQQSADHVNIGAEQMSTAAQALAEGSTNQASAVQDILASINNFEQAILKDANEAKSSAEVAGDAGTSLMESFNKMSALKDAIYEINESSEKIEGIIKTIDDIANQTNLLALNAAIEAARAGEAGKGFAVVADEVKNLANASSEAANDTTELIQNSISSIKKGTDIAELTSQDLEQVIEHANVSVEMMAAIANSSRSKVDEIKGIIDSANQIAKVVEVNSATAQESAAAGEEQSAQAQVLSDLLNQFELNI